MMMSPASSCGSRSAIAASTTAAGTMSQIARGFCESRDERGNGVGARGTFTGERPHRVRGSIVDDALMPAAHQAAHHVAAHAAEADHS